MTTGTIHLWKWLLRKWFCLVLIILQCQIFLHTKHTCSDTYKRINTFIPGPSLPSQSEEAACPPAMQQPPDLKTELTYPAGEKPSYSDG